MIEIMFFSINFDIYINYVVLDLDIGNYEWKIMYHYSYLAVHRFYYYLSLQRWMKICINGMISSASPAGHGQQF